MRGANEAGLHSSEVIQSVYVCNRWKQSPCAGLHSSEVIQSVCVCNRWKQSPCGGMRHATACRYALRALQSLAYIELLRPSLQSCLYLASASFAWQVCAADGSPLPGGQQLRGGGQLQILFAVHVRTLAFAIKLQCYHLQTTPVSTSVSVLCYAMRALCGEI